MCSSFSAHLQMQFKHDIVRRDSNPASGKARDFLSCKIPYFSGFYIICTSVLTWCTNVCQAQLGRTGMIRIVLAAVLAISQQIYEKPILY